MKIVLLSMNFAPELTGIGKYSGEMVDAWIARGHDVTVVCAPPYYPQRSLLEGYSSRSWRREQPVPGLTVIRCPVWLPKSLGGLKRLLHLASFALSSLPVMLRLVLWRPAVVFVVAPALFSAPAAWLTARLSGAKCWLHIQDLEVDAAFELGLLKGRWLRSATLAAERALLRSFDVVSTISARMLRHVVAKGVPANSTALLPNWVDLSLVRPTDRSQALRDQLGISTEQIVCLFAGTINRKQGLEVLIHAAHKLLEHPKIVLIICGFGELRTSLEVAAQGLTNVRFIDLRPMGELNELLNMADIHMLPQLRGAADLVMPSKLTGMLASGRPVIAAADPETEIASVLDGCGIVTEPESAQGFADAILALAADSARREAYGANARAYAERVLDATAVFDRLDAQLAALCAGVGPLVQPSSAADAKRAVRATIDA
jgi:colanic acid biosynthesis glycosyl transferase WcaI